MAMNIGTRVSFRPRNAPADSTWMPSGNWKVAAYSSRVEARPATARSLVYTPTMASWPNSSTAADNVCVPMMIA
ncbi:hypothetical protein G6F63_016972 [Rhizopus arrhizus]|nr:hypothetical protein G6F63_016972 [Rhizopus arrhizus]